MSVTSPVFQPPMSPLNELALANILVEGAIINHARGLASPAAAP